MTTETVARIEAQNMHFLSIHERIFGLEFPHVIKSGAALASIMMGDIAIIIDVSVDSTKLYISTIDENGAYFMNVFSRHTGDFLWNVPYSSYAEVMGALGGEDLIMPDEMIYWIKDTLGVDAI